MFVQMPGFPFGLDLAAINIQRGRDHGIPPYTHWRVPCGLSSINTWEEFANVVGPESARRISHAYQNVHDIDLFVGGIAERPVVGGLVGPTFACIIAQQFSNSRKGDRFWYENAGFESSFTPAQLHSIRKVTLASVLCRTVGGGTFQPHIFLPPDIPQNERLPCGVGSLSDFDLDPWLEQDPFTRPKPVPLQISTPAPLQAQVQTRPPPAPLTLPQPPLPPPEHPPQLPATPPPSLSSFDPPVLDRIFEIVQGELETNAPIPEDFIANNKVGFMNRRPPATKHPIFIPPSNSLNSFIRVKNSSKINDKLDLKHKGGTGHVTKQKPVPGVNNKLDKNSRKGSHRHGSVQTTTRRTIIVNNIPIELRHASTSDVAEGGTTANTNNKLESRTEDLKLTTETEPPVGANNSLDSDLSISSRTEDLDIVETNIRPDHISKFNETITTENELESREETIHQTNIDSASTQTSISTDNIEEDLTATEESISTHDIVSNGKEDKDTRRQLEPREGNNDLGTMNKTEHAIGLNLESRENNDHEIPKQKEDILNTELADLINVTELELESKPKNVHTNKNGITAFGLKTDTTDIKTDELVNEKREVIDESDDRNQDTISDSSIRTESNSKEIDAGQPETTTNHSDLLGQNETKDENGLKFTKLFTDVKPNANDTDSTTSINTLHSEESDIDPLVNSPTIDHRRVQRKLTLPSTTEEHKEKPKLSALKAIAKTNISLPVYDKPQTTKLPKPFRTTVRNVELRQYQKRPPFSKPPHKVIVDSVNGDNQYEIEINIRQTNKSPNPLQSTPDYTTNYKTNPYDRYTGNYASFPSTTPLYAYIQQPQSQVPHSLTTNQRTKPPTIIFLNEHDERGGTTTRQPGFVHSIVGWNSGGQRPSPADLDPNDRPGYEGVLSRPHNGAILPPTYPNSRPNSVSSFSHTQLNGGIVQATSQAISNGHYGSISGYASANGADSTFSFNIRPKPDKTQLNRPDGLASYGFGQTPPKNWYNHKPDYNEQNPSYEIPHRESVPSPFSTSNSQTYYIRKKARPQLKEDLTFYQSPGLRDYDYLSRTRKPASNITALDDTDETLDEEYDYDDDYGNTPLLRKFNQDGYLRPELMLGTINKTSVSEVSPSAANQTLDDNYVLPALNSTKDIPKDVPVANLYNVSIDFPDTQGKQLNNDIFAEDLEDPEDSADEDSSEDDEAVTLLELQQKRFNILKRHQEKIAFAPITVLTKPER